MSTLERNAGWWREEKKEMGFHHVYSFIYKSLFSINYSSGNYQVLFKIII